MRRVASALCLRRATEVAPAWPLRFAAAAFAGRRAAYVRSGFKNGAFVVVDAGSTKRGAAAEDAAAAVPGAGAPLSPAAARKAAQAKAAAAAAAEEDDFPTPALMADVPVLRTRRDVEAVEKCFARLAEWAECSHNSGIKARFRAMFYRLLNCRLRACGANAPPAAVSAVVAHFPERVWPCALQAMARDGGCNVLDRWAADGTAAVAEVVASGGMTPSAARHALAKTKTASARELLAAVEKPGSPFSAVLTPSAARALKEAVDGVATTLTPAQVDAHAAQIRAVLARYAASLGPPPPPSTPSRRGKAAKTEAAPMPLFLDIVDGYRRGEASRCVSLIVSHAEGSPFSMPDFIQMLNTTLGPVTRATGAPQLASRGAEIFGNASSFRFFGVSKVAGERFPARLQIQYGRPKCLACLLLHRTGPLDFVAALRERAHSVGFQLREDSLCPVVDGRPVESQHVVCNTEADVFAAIGAVYVPPEARTRGLPRLVPSFRPPHFKFVTGSPASAVATKKRTPKEETHARTVDI